jgi:hypothetical protein
MRNVVGAEKNTHTAHADENSDDLEQIVPNLEEEEGQNYDDYNSPEVDELHAVILLAESEITVSQ